MLKEPSFEADFSQHKDAKALAWAAILFYPIGLLVLNAALLCAARDAIRSSRPTALSRSISFLYREFKPHLFWWELVEVRLRIESGLFPRAAALPPSAQIPMVFAPPRCCQMLRRLVLVGLMVCQIARLSDCLSSSHPSPRLT